MAGYGMQGHIGIVGQSNFNTAGGVNSLSYIPIVDESLTLNIETIQEESMYGRFAQSPTHKGTQVIEGDISLEAHPIALGSILTMYMGSASLSVVDSHGVHTFQPATSDFSSRSAGQPYTIEVNRDVGSSFFFSDILAGTLELSVSNGELMNASVGVIGAGYGRTASTSPTFPDGTPFKWDMSSCSYDGADVVDLEDLTITINKNLEGVYTLVNTNAPYKILRSDNEMVEISGTMIFQSHSYMLDYENFNEKRFFANFQGVGSDSLLIDIPSMKFTSYEPAMSGKGRVQASFNAMGLFNAGSGTAIEITLTNTRTASYL